MGVNGDYIIPFLPPGLYTITWELAGFQTATRANLQVVIAKTQRVDAQLAVAGLSETVQATGAAPTEVAPNLTVASTYQAADIERLPVGRTLNAAVLLAPNVSDNGPGGNIMIAGAVSYENLFLINGVVVNENLRGQARNVFVEDAIQETKVGEGLKAPNSNEWMAGLARQLSPRATVRADFVYKKFSDFYGDFRDLSTGKVTDPTGRVYDLTIVRNTDLANRSYKALVTQAS